MKATLEYTLPEEAEEHMSAMQGALWKSLVFEYDQALRSKLKYGNPGDKAAGLQAARDSLWESIKDAGLSLD
jgi:ABC-type nitrate/sulfonate/bicarbonate transport system substrate-binding protein